MEEKDLQKQQEYTFTVPRAEGQKVYHFGARRFKLLAGAVLICTVCMAVSYTHLTLPTIA